MARVAHAMAMECPRVVADVVEIQEYPHLAQAYGVRGIPMTVINDSVQFNGMVTEEVFLARLLEAIGERTPDEDMQDVNAQTTNLI